MAAYFSASQLSAEERTNPNFQMAIAYISQLEKNVSFLQSGQTDVLRSLYSEVDALKKKNQDLTLQSMLTGSSNSTTANTSEPSRISVQKESQMIELEVALHEEKLKTANVQEELQSAQDEICRLNLLTQQLLEASRHINTTTNLDQQSNTEQQQKQEKPRKEQEPTEVDHVQESLVPNEDESQMSSICIDGLDAQQIADIIRKLQLENSTQASEMHMLQTSLQELLFMHKWTPEVYRLASTDPVGLDKTKAIDVFLHNRSVNAGIPKNHLATMETQRNKVHKLRLPPRKAPTQPFVSELTKLPNVIMASNSATETEIETNGSPSVDQHRYKKKQRDTTHLPSLTLHVGRVAVDRQKKAKNMRKARDKQLRSAY